MQFELSEKLIKKYSEDSKNPNYSLTFLLNSLDPNICVSAIKLVDVFNLQGNVITYEIDEKNIKIIKTLFKEIDNKLIEKLLWIALLLPEM